MIEALRREGITDERVLGAMAEIPRHLFVDEGIASRAYEDVALPIGHGQTISSPFDRRADDRSCCSRSGRWARCSRSAPAAATRRRCSRKLVKEVYTLERIAPLMDKARRHLRDLRFYNVRFKHADGHGGYPEGAPYDGILMAASATHVPRGVEATARRRRTHGAAGGHRRPVALRGRSHGEADSSRASATRCASCRCCRGSHDQRASRSSAVRAPRSPPAPRGRPAPVVGARVDARRAARRARAPSRPRRAPSRGKPTARTHAVKRGETLVSIALQYGLDYRELAAWNNITNPT